ncbi:putative reverse transcriptase domain-containing protein [Tanacetum coccineum]|uniref:Reverse transcriptase domain-containing protein n=1 Tax=Tanacetum coccineum TaxID=301880 RepID=A0ABQ5EZB7_9ASTR
MAEYSYKWHNGTSRGRSTETSDGLVAIQAQLNNLGREIKKVNEKFYAAQVGCEQCKGPHYTKDCPLKEEGKTLEEAYYTNNTNHSYQERRQSMEDILSKFMSESAKRHEENSNLIKEIRASTDDAIRNHGASIKTLEIQIGQMSKVLQERVFGSLPSSTKTNLRDQVKLISTTMEADSHSIRRIGSSQYVVSTRQNNTLLYKSRQMMVPFSSRLDNHYCDEEEGNYGPKFVKAYEASHINNIIPRKGKDPGSFTLPCFINNVCFDNALVDLGASVSVMPLLTYLNLGLGELAHTSLTVELADRTVKYLKGIAENILVGIDYIDLNDLNEPFELGRNQGDYLIPTIEEGEVIEEFRTRNDELNTGIDDYPSYCDDDKKIHIDCAHNLKFSCMIGFGFTHANFFPLLYVNMMSKKIHNSIMKYEMVYNGNNVVGALMNVPIFVGTFSVMTDFTVLENMDAYRDEGMGDIIFGEPFLREVGIKAKRFEGMITLYKGDDEVTYQMVRSHPRFKHHTNEQCNKIPPLLKVSEKDKMNGFSHAYQKLKGFYKGVLNLGPDYIRNAKTEEWHIRWHISMHEME